MGSRPADHTPVGTIRPIGYGEIAGVDDLVDTRSIDRPRRRGRVIVRLVALVLLAAIVYYVVTFFQVWSTGRADQANAAEPVDAIVVMGAAQYDGDPSPQLAARLDHVVTLFQAGIAPLVVVTGGNQPGDRFTEAEASAAYLIERGIPDSAILRENEGATSFESLNSVARLLAERQLSSVVIVTDPFHALRSRLIAQNAGLVATVSPTPTSVVTGSDELKRELVEAGGIAIGRIIGFDRI